MGRPLPLPLAKPSSALCLSRGRREDRNCGPKSKWEGQFQPGRTLGDCARARDRSEVPPEVWRRFPDSAPASAPASFCTSLPPLRPNQPEATRDRTGARLGLVAKAPRAPHLALGLPSTCNKIQAAPLVSSQLGFPTTLPAARLRPWASGTAPAQALAASTPLGSPDRGEAGPHEKLG